MVNSIETPVFPEGVPVMSVEALGTQGWHRWAHAPFGLGRFGSSGPVKDMYPKFGFGPENIAAQVTARKEGPNRATSFLASLGVICCQ